MPLPNTENTEPSNKEEYGKIEDGWYQVEITKQKERTSTKGNSWVKLWLRSERFSGYAWLDVSLNPGKLGKLKLLKQSIGLPDTEANPEKLVGGKIWAYCFTDEGGYGSASKIGDVKQPPPKEDHETVFYDDQPF